MVRIRSGWELRAGLMGLAVLVGGFGCSDAAERNRVGEVPSAFPDDSGAGAGGSSQAAPGTPNTPDTSSSSSEATGNLPLEPGAGGSAPGSSAGSGGNSTPEPPSLSRVLVFTRTLGYRHDSIGAGVAAIQKLGMEHGFTADQTEDPSQFNDATLADYDVVIWLSTTADVLDDAQQGAFQRYIEAGGGWVGVHAASDTEYDWPWYGQLLGNGAWFLQHPAIQTAQLDVETADHAATAHLPARFPLEDEWYNFRANPRSAVNVLLRLDESSYAPGEGAMGDHPIAWYHEFDGGRAFYTALGHRTELYTDPQFTQHLLGGIQWAAGL